MKIRKIRIPKGECCFKCAFLEDSRNESPVCSLFECFLEHGTDAVIITPHRCMDCFAEFPNGAVFELKENIK